MGANRTGLSRSLVHAMSLGALLACLWVPGLALGYELNNEGLPIIPLTIVNKINLPTPLYIYIVGTIGKRSRSGIDPGKTLYVSDLQGNVTQTPAIPVSAPASLGLNLGAGITTQMMIPKLDGHRIYLSLVNPLLVNTNNQIGAPPGSPCGWCGPFDAVNNPNQNTFFDWAETAWVDKDLDRAGHTTNFGGNVTQVDMFGFPMALTVEGTDPASDTQVIRNAGFDDTVTRPMIMNSFRNLGVPWTGLIETNGSDTLRVLAPYHGMERNTFPKDYLNGYIDQVFTYYTTHTLTVEAACGQDKGVLHHFTGSTAGGILVFSESGTPVFQYQKADMIGATVFRNEFHPNPKPSTELYMCLSGVVSTKLGGAFMRTAMTVNTDLDLLCRQVKQFYVDTPVVSYAKIFHDFGVDHKAYSFGYDDSCSQSSFITVDDPTSMTVTIQGVRK
jgi:hypothetical protein